MFGKQSDSRDDYQPLGYVGGFAVYVTTLLVIVYIAAMVALVLVQSARGIYLHVLLQFGQVELVGGRAIGGYDIWRFFTYPLVNAPSIWFAVEMYLLAFFGREVERFIGRRSFGMLYFMLVLLAPCLVLVTKMWLPWQPLQGSGTVNFAVFIAFATLYPGVEIFWTLKAMWIAVVILAINSLSDLAAHDWTDLILMWATCGFAFLAIKYLRGHISLPHFSMRDYFRRRRSQRSLRAMPPPPPRAPRPAAPPQDDVIESIDPLLDKIAEHGINSLTPREREKLEQARAELLKKPGR